MCNSAFPDQKTSTNQARGQALLENRRSQGKRSPRCAKKPGIPAIPRRMAPRVNAKHTEDCWDRVAPHQYHLPSYRCPCTAPPQTMWPEMWTKKMVRGIESKAAGRNAQKFLRSPVLLRVGHRAGQRGPQGSFRGAPSFLTADCSRGTSFRTRPVNSCGYFLHTYWSR